MKSKRQQSLDGCPEDHRDLAEWNTHYGLWVQKRRAGALSRKGLHGYILFTRSLSGVMVPCLPGQGESSQCLMCKIFSSLDLVNASSQILSYLEISSWKRGWIHMANRVQHTHVTQAYCTPAFSPSALLYTQRPTHCIYLELSVSNKQPL